MKMQRLSLRIDWGDVDMLGHVNNVSIVRYCQAARVVFAEKIGLPVSVGMKQGPVEAAASIQFKKQLFYPGNIDIYTGIQEIKNTSIVLLHRICDEAGDVAVEAVEVIVFFDFEKQTKIPLTADLKRCIADYCSTLDEII